MTALEHAREAVRLDPQNMQYQMLLQRLEGGGEAGIRHDRRCMDFRVHLITAIA